MGNETPSTPGGQPPRAMATPSPTPPKRTSTEVSESEPSTGRTQEPVKITRWWIFGVTAFSIYLIVLHLVLIYVLVKAWPGTIPLTDTDREVVLLRERLVLTLPLERRYLLLVAVAGALGSYIHLATSFTEYVGNRAFRWSWALWYLLRPFIGMALAVILYFAIRGGLITGTGATETLNLYGVAALAGLAGMFSKQATDKLREVFENFFKTEKESVRGDKPQQKDTDEGKTKDGGQAQSEDKTRGKG